MVEVLVDPGLCGGVLVDPGLCGRVLVDPGLCGGVLVDPGLCGCSTVSTQDYVVVVRIDHWLHGGCTG